MGQLVYEFDSVYGKNGESKFTDAHKNPVYIMVALVGQGAVLPYVDSEGNGITTSKVESIFIHGNSVNIVTKNTEYWLKPHIREV